MDKKEWGRGVEAKKQEWVSESAVAVAGQPALG